MTSADHWEEEEINPFWIIEDEISELFSRLACEEAIQAVENVDKLAKPLYPEIPYKMFFLFCSSFGAATFWFNGSWVDGLLAGILRIFVNFISGWNIFSREERILLEAVASLCVGAAAGFLTTTFPARTCSDAIALGGVLSLLQGFKIVYAIIELLSKHTVMGGANLFEAILYTALIAFMLVGGQEAASSIIGTPADNRHLSCDDPIDEAWYFLLVPLGSLSWSGLFNPLYKDLPLMAFHGTLAYAVSWSMGKIEGLYDGFGLFIAAAVVSLSAGLSSRFTGRSAMGNTIAGLNALVPGAFLVRLFQVNDAAESLAQLGEALVRSGLIGTGAWTGTLLCSPIILGISAAQAESHRFHSNGQHSQSSSKRESERTGPVLFF